eukprot:m51a1_g8167 putative C-tail anchored protein (726) ;mRNA; r:97440-100101
MLCTVLLLSLAHASARAAQASPSWPSPVSVGSLPAGFGYVLDATRDQLQLGDSSCGAGNLDGVAPDDVLIGSFWATSNAGRTTALFGRPGRWPSQAVDVSRSSLSAPGSRGFVWDGAHANDKSGAVACLGDVDGDRYDDVAIGALRAGAGGSAWVVFGGPQLRSQSSPHAAVLNSSYCSTGGRCTYVVGAAGEQLGSMVAGLGDVDGDRFADVLVGAAAGAGRAYVLLGHAGPWPSTIATSDVGSKAVPGYVVDGVSDGDQLASGQVSTARGGGDFNHDGLRDVVLGAHGLGKAYVIFGSADRAAVSRSALSGLDGRRGCTLSLAQSNVYFGQWIGVLGDVNGDAVDDLAVSAKMASTPSGYVDGGAVYVIFGRSGVWPPQINVEDLNGANGGVILYGNGRASSVAGADVNGDGLRDIVVGAYYSGAGSVFVMFGHSGAWKNTDLQTLNGTDGFVLTGAATGDYLGVSVSNANDVDGDGVDDIVATATVRYENYVILGNRAPRIARNELSLELGRSTAVSPEHILIEDNRPQEVSIAVVAVRNGFFSLSSAAAVPVTAFSWANVTNGALLFTSTDHSAAPSYTLRASDGILQSPESVASVTVLAECLGNRSLVPKGKCEDGIVDADALAKLKAELEVLLQLTGDQIVLVVSADGDPGVVDITMPLIKVDTLDNLVKKPESVLYKGDIGKRIDWEFGLRKVLHVTSASPALSPFIAIGVLSIIAIR